ncbi:MAG: radical SAM protein [Flavobacteriaceae bacterium CG2_30_34_30]|nr:radical SAM protein [Flavobacteriia bacterium]OIP49325.1 MAG: radical SAM protein [Flavobacteriaceae bacterium CG2_30_34_30]PIQ17495.1 MAG: radical SAM protein [Flavobacteriaceae bacterium CG18_big_fil_WC_8_21_14_2_50_34_36]PIV50255.1 MAG: radical SAM protein [Flavobacteriaceae bacterium CG02_land_8_20_14_3_00_34_13]PIZ06832.1 MAG: radical SAM protein [Flavobacteriaceae bacterium CG_4_10_14_0_8_um_filter_34_31]PJC08116.1 MAG: radical SAM protein [Flavobacteriaceae bacterium CG_4_9_14_0_8_um
MKDILLLTPPFTQMNTPYPATAYLKGFLNTKGISAFQMDLGMEVILEIFSNKNLQKLFDIAIENDTILSENAKRIFALKERYLQPLEEVIRFLQGKNSTFSRQICTKNFLPRASRFEQLDDMDWAFGSMGMQDKAKHIATLYLEDLSDFIVECIDENFGFSRYAERLGRSANSFDELYNHLQQKLTFIDEISLTILENRIQSVLPKMVGISVPFPGNLYSAFRCAQFLKTNYPEIKIIMGGGFPNTELRSVADLRVFDFFDFITLDDGELPIELLLSNVQNPSLENPNFNKLKRTFLAENGAIIYNNSSTKPDYKQAEVGTPDYSDLFLTEYISVIEIANPMHSLWSDGRWNKLTMAHGCYWGKCTFCDISLDYVKLYQPVAAKLLVDRMEQLIAQTGENGFHFVDEAAPPALMKAVALEILKRKLTVTWWTNIRFEKSFTRDLCVLLNASGCIAISGGLEVASDRLLKLIEKGVTVEQVAQVTRNLTQANIMVHCYLMYGYPSQTVQETVDSLEMVRQLFDVGVLQSGFWHQFALTAHSPIGLNPKNFGITPHIESITFANNDIQFTDATGINHSKFSYGLDKSLFNFMHGIGLDTPLQQWFDFKIPKTQVAAGLIQSFINEPPNFNIKPTATILWLGGIPIVVEQKKTKRGITRHQLHMQFHDIKESFHITLEKKTGDWLAQKLMQLTPHQEIPVSYAQLKADFETYFEDFELFWFSKPIMALKQHGLLVV